MLLRALKKAPGSSRSRAVSAVLTLVLLLAGCQTGGEPPDGNGDGGRDGRISGRVSGPVVSSPGGDFEIVAWAYDNGFPGNRPTPYFEVGSGLVRGDTLELSLGTPPDSAMRPAVDFGFNPHDPGLRLAWLMVRAKDGSSRLELGNTDTRKPQERFRPGDAVAYLAYADRDAVMREPSDTDPAAAFQVRKGWNVLAFTYVLSDGVLWQSLSAGSLDDLYWYFIDFGHGEAPAAGDLRIESAIADYGGPGTDIVATVNDENRYGVITGDGRISADGGLTLTLRPAPGDTLRSMDEMGPSVTTTDPAARSAVLSHIVTSDEIVGYLRVSNSAESFSRPWEEKLPGDVLRTSFWYVDRPVRVTYTDTDGIGNRSVNDLDLKPGWNLVVSRVVTVHEWGYDLESGVEPLEGFEWFYLPAD